MKNRYVFLSLAFMAFATLRAQSTFYNWGLGVHPSLYSFYALDNGIATLDEYEPGVMFSISRYLNKSFDLGAELGIGVVRHPDLLDNFVNGERPRHRDNFMNAQLVGRYKLDNGYIIKEDAIVSPFLKAGFGMNKNPENWHPAIPMGVGINFRIEKIAASIVVQTAYNQGIGAPSFLQHSAGLNLNMGHRTLQNKVKIPKVEDRDYDGVPDNTDACPDAFGTGRSKGCPDADNDGLKDQEDRCPDQSGFANLMGCLDSDYDGVIDPDDKCPTTFGDSPNGCPDSRPNDADGDGVVDSEDLCPNVSGFFTAKGCPDRDGDGVKDSDDKCPDQYGEAKDNGCPPMPTSVWLPNRNGNNDVTATGNNTAGDKWNGRNESNGDGNKSSFNGIDPKLSDEEYCKRVSLSDLGRAYFNVDVTKPKGNSYAELNQIIEVMKRCAAFTLTIAGHADSDGPESYNQRLSERRAENVRKYFTSKGVAGDRLQTKAFGESQPTVPNDSRDNKQKNRRVEFQLAPKN